MIKFFPEHTNWYKGNLHSHTTNSDGAWTPDEAVENYKANGYAFLCLSDHNLYTDYRYKYNSDLFLILPGTEIAALPEQTTILFESGVELLDVAGGEFVQRNRTQVRDDVTSL